MFLQRAVHTFLYEEPYLVQAYSGVDLRGFMLDIGYTCYGRRGRRQYQGGFKSNQTRNLSKPSVTVCFAEGRGAGG